jgi:predicted Rossmann fold nucleotide-binding protein DprA/Smf involved in DNA uptake
MRVAVIGSRELVINNLKKYLLEDTAEIVSGGARGIDNARRRGVPVNVYLQK